MTLCPVCNTDASFEKILDLKSIRSDETFSVGQCASCGVQKVLNVPDDINKYYANTHMRQKLNSIHASLKSILLKKELSRILQSSDHTDRTFVDIGGGVGDFAKLIHDSGFRVISVDGDASKPVEIESIDEIPYYTIDYNTDYTIANFTGIKNGTVILRHVLEHIRHPADFIKTLVSRGVNEFYIVVPNHGAIEAKVFGQYYYFYDPPLHLWFFNKSTLEKLLTSLNFEIINSGFDTIPNIVSSLYRYLLIKGAPRGLCDLLRPQSVINSLSAPLNILLPNNVLWAHARLKTN